MKNDKVNFVRIMYFWLTKDIIKHFERFLKCMYLTEDLYLEYILKFLWGMEKVINSIRKKMGNRLE